MSFHLPARVSKGVAVRVNGGVAGSTVAGRTVEVGVRSGELRTISLTADLSGGGGALAGGHDEGREAGDPAVGRLAPPQRPPGWIAPDSYSRITACTRSRTPSFMRMWATWVWILLVAIVLYLAVVGARRLWTS